MKNKSNLFLFGSFILILFAILLVSILGKSKSSDSSTDVRARAGTKNVLKLVGFVSSVNELQGTLEVTGVQFTSSSLSGEPQNLGDWTITAPAAFNFASVYPGTTVTIGVDSNTFNIASHSVTALTLTVGN